ncbi:MAG: hypothetical protein F6K23_02365 [Okeania sp. SIO2C9]|uniref:hypothetical protein n=1 Tax=Okeania sp. SIO2C9 TaxID=2607791 RepID=UPI0013BF57A9|nr:hypothetical protein [Okeania sp. SIO2C9]NEQ72017.1 hypothetical protein [Okeania sp. SIO2C9]
MNKKSRVRANFTQQYNLTREKISCQIFFPSMARIFLGFELVVWIERAIVIMLGVILRYL